MPMNLEVERPHIEESAIVESDKASSKSPASESQRQLTPAERAIGDGDHFRKNLIKEDGTEAHTALAKLHVLNDFLEGESQESPQFSLKDKHAIQDAMDLLRHLRKVVQDIPRFLNRQSSDFRREKEQDLLAVIAEKSNSQLAEIDSQLNQLNVLLSKARDFDEFMSSLRVDLIDEQAKQYDRRGRLAPDVRLAEMKRDEVRQQEQSSLESSVSRFTTKLKLELAAVAVALSIGPTAAAQDGLPTVTEIVEDVSAAVADAFDQITEHLQNLNLTASSILEGMNNSIEARMAQLGMLAPEIADINIPGFPYIQTEAATGEYQLPFGLQRAFLGAEAAAAARVTENSDIENADSTTVEAAALQETSENPQDVLGVETAPVTPETAAMLFDLLQTQFNESNAAFAQLNIQYEVADGQISFFIGDQGPFTYNDLGLQPGSEIETAFVRLATQTMFVQNQQPGQPIGRQQIELVAQRASGNQFAASIGLRVLNPFTFPFRGSNLPMSPGSFMVFREQTIHYDSPVPGSTIEMLPVDQNILDILSQYPELTGHAQPQLGENIVAEIIELPNENGELVRVPLTILANGDLIRISSSYRVVPRDNTSAVNVRRESNTQSGVLGVLRNDTAETPTPVPTQTPEVSQTGELWIKVNWNGDAGFIRADLVKILGLPARGLPKAAEVGAGRSGNLDTSASVNSEILASAPASILTTNESGEVTSLPIARIENQDGQIVAVDAEGKVLAVRIPYVERNNEWFILKSESQGIVPTSFYMSSKLSSLDEVNSLVNWLRSRSLENTASLILEIQSNTATDVRIHEAQNSNLMNLPDPAALNQWRAEGIYLHPAFNEVFPTNGQDQIDAIAIYLAALQLDGNYEEARNLIENGPGVEITLPNGDRWNPQNGLNVINRRSYSDLELTSMISNGRFNLLLPPRISVDENGQLSITLLNLDIDSSNVTWGLIYAFSQISKHNGQTLAGDPTIAYDPHIVSIAFSPNSVNTDWTWLVDVGRSTEEIRPGQSISYDFQE